MKTIITLLITFITVNSFAQITYYENREALHNNCSATLVLEDFEGGPTDAGNTGCDGDFSAAGNSCYPAGEIQPGIVITSSDNSSDTPMAFTNVGFVSNPTGIVGTNQFENYTIMNFPEGNVNTVALTLYGAPRASTMHVRIFNIAGDLIDSLTITDGMPGPYFFGFIATEFISSIEFQAEGFSIEMVGMVEFGACSTASVTNLNSYDFTYFPNPAKNTITLNANTKITSISILDILGKQVQQVIPLSNTSTFDISHLAVGSYFIKVIIGDKIGIYKLLKE